MLNKTTFPYSAPDKHATNLQQVVSKLVKKTRILSKAELKLLMILVEYTLPQAEIDENENRV
jgi:hypothetical protein